jgi:hypothetical protein
MTSVNENQQDRPVPAHAVHLDAGLSAAEDISATAPRAATGLAPTPGWSACLLAQIRR